MVTILLAWYFARSCRPSWMIYSDKIYTKSCITKKLRVYNAYRDSTVFRHVFTLRWSYLHYRHSCIDNTIYSLQWRHNDHDSVSNHQPHDCLLNRLFRRRSKKTSKLRATGLCAGNSPGTGKFPAQMACNAEDVSIWWRHHVITEAGSWFL